MAPDCEGTPSFHTVDIKDHDLDNSKIVFRFHYWMNSDVDQQALGTLTGWYDWKTEVLTSVNEKLKKMGYKGNLGSRQEFQLQDDNQDYYLVETQKKKEDWESWRIMVTRGFDTPLKQLDVNIPESYGTNVGFANPNMTKVTKKDGTVQFIISLFCFGAHPGGVLLYVIEPFDSTTVSKK